jgi:hypothetical protein
MFASSIHPLCGHSRRTAEVGTTRLTVTRCESMCSTLSVSTFRPLVAKAAGQGSSSIGGRGFDSVLETRSICSIKWADVSRSSIRNTNTSEIFPCGLSSDLRQPSSLWEMRLSLVIRSRAQSSSSTKKGLSFVSSPPSVGIQHAARKARTSLRSEFHQPAQNLVGFGQHLDQGIELSDGIPLEDS